jgi:thiamine-phosphate pyrophosphorylase
MMKKYIKFPNLYAISPAEANTQILLTKVESALKAGVHLVQYRDKSLNSSIRIEQAKALRTLCNQYNTLLLINDDMELAKMCKADGVHLGQSDSTLLTAREYLGENAIIGITCHDNLDLAQKAVNTGADYISFGCFFPSKTKPHAKPASLSVLTKAKEQFKLPIVAIGGITKENAQLLIEAGADSLAMSAGLFDNPDIGQLSCEILSIMKS